MAAEWVLRVDFTLILLLSFFVFLHAWRLHRNGEIARWRKVGIRYPYHFLVLVGVTDVYIVILALAIL